MARFNVTLNVAYLTGPRAGSVGQRPLNHQLGPDQGVSSPEEAHEWLDFVVVGGRFQVEKSSESYRVNSAVVTAA